MGSQGQGEGGGGAGAWEASDGCESPPSGTAETRQLQTSIRGETGLRVIFWGAPRS